MQDFIHPAMDAEMIDLYDHEVAVVEPARAGQAVGVL